jgi:hypothetical protein
MHHRANGAVLAPVRADALPPRHAPVLRLGAPPLHAARAPPPPPARALRLPALPLPAVPVLRLGTRRRFGFPRRCFLPRARLRLRPRRRFLSRPCCRLLRPRFRLRRLPHHRHIVPDLPPRCVIAHHVVAPYAQPYVGNRQVHSPVGIRRLQPVRRTFQAIVEQPQPPHPAAPRIVHNHVLRHPRPRVMLHLDHHVVLARVWRNDLDDQRRARPLDCNLKRAPVAPFAHAGDDHHVRSVRAQVGEVPRDAHIAEHNRPTGRLQARAQHRSEVHPVGLVAIAVHDEVSHFRMEHVVEGERNLFEVMGIIGGGTRHEAPPVAERVSVGVGGEGWSGRCSRHGSIIAKTGGVFDRPVFIIRHAPSREAFVLHSVNPRNVFSADGRCAPATHHPGRACYNGAGYIPPPR